MLAGIIAGALGGAAQQGISIADDQIKQNQRAEMLRMQAEIEREKLAYADELAKNRALWEVTGDYAKAKTEAETARERSLQGVRTDAAVSQAQRMIPVKAEELTTLAPIQQSNAVSQAKAVKQAEGEVEHEQTLARGGDRNYLNAVAALSNAKESSATRAAAAKTVYEMNRQKYVDNLRDVASGLMAAGDKAGAEEQLRVADMASGKAQAKNFTDVAAFAKVLEAQAASLIDPAKGGDPTNPDNVAQATAIRQRIQEMAADVSSKRGVAGGGGGPAAPAAPSIPAPKTKEEFDKLPKGARYTAPDGSVRIKQ